MVSARCYCRTVVTLSSYSLLRNVDIAFVYVSRVGAQTLLHGLEKFDKTNCLIRSYRFIMKTVVFDDFKDPKKSKKSKKSGFYRNRLFIRGEGGKRRGGHFGGS